MEAERILTLRVSKTDGCSVVKAGDCWTVSGAEVCPQRNAKLCAPALYSLFPHLQSVAQLAPQGRAMPAMLLRCHNPGCGTFFVLDVALTAAPEAAQVCVTRRLERGALAAGAMLKEAGTFLSRMGQEDAAKLVSACEKKDFKNGEVLLAAGARGERLYLVGEGQVEVVRCSPKDGSETILAVLGTGECFGEMSLLTGEPTSASVRARSDGTVHSVGRHELDELLVQLPQLNGVFSHLLAARLRAVNVTLESELGRGILGKLSMISMIDLVQTLNASRRTGTLVLAGSGQEAQVVFRDGNIVGATLGARKGPEAFFDVSVWPDGDFCFEQQRTEIPPDADIKMNTMSLLMESMRRMDEQHRGG